jgi:hypothetical protein
MRKIFLFIVTFVAIVAFGSVAMAEQGTASRIFTSPKVSGLENSSAGSNVLTYASLMTVGYAVSNWYVISPVRNGAFMSFDMYGVPVKNRSGEFLGSVRDMMMGDTGRGVFAITDIGSHHKYSKNGGLTAIPVAALKVSETKSGKVYLVLNSTETKLEYAPIFDPAKIDNPQYVADIYKYYGIQPSWTESF